VEERLRFVLRLKDGRAWPHGLIVPRVRYLPGYRIQRVRSWGANRPGASLGGLFSTCHPTICIKPEIVAPLSEVTGQTFSVSFSTQPLRDEQKLVIVIS